MVYVRKFSLELGGMGSWELPTRLLEIIEWLGKAGVRLGELWIDGKLYRELERFKAPNSEKLKEVLEELDDREILCLTDHKEVPGCAFVVSFRKRRDIKDLIHKGTSMGYIQTLVERLPDGYLEPEKPVKKVRKVKKVKRVKIGRK